MQYEDQSQEHKQKGKHQKREKIFIEQVSSYLQMNTRDPTKDSEEGGNIHG